MKILPQIVLILFGLSACGEATISTGGNGDGDGSTTTTFQIGSALWNIEAGAGQGSAIHLMTGNFFNDNAGYPDLILLTTSGAYYYKSTLPSGNGWQKNLGRIDATAGTYGFGIALETNLDSNNLTDLFLYREATPRFEIVLNSGNDTFNLEKVSPFTTNTRWMSYSPFLDRSRNKNKFHVLAVSDAGGAHRLMQIDNSAFSNTNTQLVASAVQSAIKSLAADFNSDGYTDFVIIPEDGSVSPLFLINNNDSSFTETNGTFVRSGSEDYRDAILGDFDLDGTVDLLLATTGGFELYLNNSTEDDIIFQRQANLQITPEPADVVWMEFGNLTEDNNYDLIVARDGQAPILYSGLGNFQFTDITTSAFGSQLNSTFGPNSATEIKQVYIRDIDKDRVNDLLMVNDAGDITVFFNQADDSSDQD